MPAKPLTPRHAPPASLEAMRDLVMAISRNETSISMGAKTLAALGRLVEQPGLAALNTISELAHELDVNASTLSRLARSLGYDSFADFQRIFREAVSSRNGRFYSGQASRLINLPHDPTRATGSLETVTQLFGESIANIESSLDQLTDASLHEATRLLARAGKIRVHGIRQIHAVASALVYGLNLIRPNVALLDAPGKGVAESLSYMDDHDVLIVASIKPYSSIVAQTAAMAAETGIPTIAITDYRTSPLALNASHTFIVPHQSSFISNSIGAYIVLCEALVNLVARHLGKRAVEALERHETFIKRLHIETE